MKKTWLVIGMVWPLAARAQPNRALEAPAPASTAVTLDEAVRRTVSRNPSATIAAREIDRAEAIAKEVRAGWLPLLSANGTYTRLDADRELNGRILAHKSQLNGNLTLNVPLLPGRQYASWSRAKDNVAVARAASGEARRDIAVAGARAFLTVIAQRRVLSSAERALRTARAHEDYATTRFEGGVGNRLDAVRAGQERATAEVRVKNQLSSLARAQEALGVLMGEDGSVDAAEEPNLGTAISVGDALAASTRRADVVAQRDRVDVARKTAKDSWTDYLPALNAIAQPFLQDPPTVTQPKTGWQAQLVLSIPLFDGGYRYGASAERDALEAEERARLDGVLRQARSDVRVAFESIRRADEALRAARDAARLAREGLELAELAYRTGATSNIEVVDAERRAQDAEAAAALAEDASRQARLDLLAGTGRFP